MVGRVSTPAWCGRETDYASLAAGTYVVSEQIEYGQEGNGTRLRVAGLPSICHVSFSIALGSRAFLLIFAPEAHTLY